MDITKYLKNTEISITNDDLDIDALTKDLTKGMVNQKEATKDMVAKSEFDKISGEMATLQTSYDATVKTLNDTNDKVKVISLEKEMIGQGFKEEHFGEVAKLRTTLFGEEQDDKVAISSLKEKYKATYFPDTKPTVNVPNEANLQNKDTSKKPNEPIKVTRTTRLEDLIIRK